MSAADSPPVKAGSKTPTFVLEMRPFPKRKAKAPLLGERGLTIVEALIGLLLSSFVAFASFEYYKAEHRLYLAQAGISDRQGNLRAALDELSVQVRKAGYYVQGGQYARTSTRFDTLQVYVGQDGGATVDTISYYVRTVGGAKTLAKRINGQTPQTFAEGIDSVLFVPAGGSPLRQVNIVLVATPVMQNTGTALNNPRRLGATVNLRNR